MTGVLPTHAPPWHESACVHAFASVHALPFGLAGFEHAPVVGLHVPAVWHWSEALHTTGLLPTHVPLWHWSVCVHALPSLHALVLFGCVHVPVALQTSFVQTFVSALHGAPDGEYVQIAVQQSVSLVLPSSQSSPGSMRSFGHAMSFGQKPPA